MTTNQITKKVAAIIVNWNGLANTINCIDSLINSNGNDLTQIIVVDNGSDMSDEVEKLRKRYYEKIEILSLSKNLGFAGGYNKGIVYATNQKYPYILIINNDTEVTKDFLSPLIESLEKNSKIMAVAPKIYYYKSNKIWCEGGRVKKIFARGININENKVDLQSSPSRVDFLSGCCILFNSNILKKINFDERFFLYYEDVDLSLNIIKLGYKIAYIPESMIYHKSGSSTGNLLTYQRIYYLSRNKLLFVKKNYNVLAKLIFITAYPLQIILMITYFFYKNIKKPTNGWLLTKAWFRGIEDYLLRKFGQLRMSN